jgi:hypothetical protein
MATESELDAYFTKAAEKIAAAYPHAMRGGELQAFIRQGFNELGAALRAFPDSIQVDEPGQVNRPLFHDIVEDRKSYDATPRPPSRGNEPTPGPPPSPGQIAAEAQAQDAGRPDQPQATVQGNIHGYQGGNQAHGNVHGPEHGAQAGIAATPALQRPGDLAAEDERILPAQAAGREGAGLQFAQVGPSPEPTPEPIPGGFVEDVLKNRRDGYPLPRGKVLPDDQLENDKGRDR